MISVVLYGRNDSYGYNLQKRAALSLNTLAAVLDDPDDEILFVDYNTPDDLPTFVEAIGDMLVPRAREMTRVLRVRPSYHKKHFAARTHLRAIEPISRNIAIRRMNPRNRWVLSTNTDMIFVTRGAYAGQSLSQVCAALPDGFYHAPRIELPEALWETLDRMDPAGTLAQVKEWGTRLQINEIVYANPGVVYDGPGDFQLMLRSDIEAIGGFHEGMILGWHVDSNIAKRAMLLRGEVRGLQERVFGYHCDHTREATLAHKHDKVENSIFTFFYDVTTPYIPEQAETWGARDEAIEEVRVAVDLRSPFVDAMERLIPPYAGREYTVSALSDISGNEMRYLTPHVISYIANYVDTLPKHASIAYVGVRRPTFDGFVAMWKTLGFTGKILVGPLYANFLGLDGGDDVVEMVDDNEGASRADTFFIDFSLRSYPDDPGPVTDVYSRAPSDASDPAQAASMISEHDMQGLNLVSRGLIRMTSLEPWTRGEKQPRRFLITNTQNTIFEQLVIDRVMVMFTPYSTRVRHGYAQTNSDKALDLHLDTGLLDTIRLAPLMPVEVIDAADFPRRSGLSRIAAVDDVLDPQWLRWADSLYCKALRDLSTWNRYHWQTVQMFYALDRLGFLRDDASISVLYSEQPDELIRQLAGWMGTINRQKLGATMDASRRFDVVALPFSSAFAFGTRSLFRVLEVADALLEPGGVCILSSELTLYGLGHEQFLDVQLLQSGVFDESVERHTGFRLQGPLETSLSSATLQRFQVDRAGETPNFIYMDTTGSMRTSVVLVYQKAGATPAGGWKNVENDLLAALARTTLERDPLAIAQAFAPAEPPLRRVPNARFGAGYDDDPPATVMRFSIWNSLTKTYGADAPPVIVPFYGGVRLAAHMGNDLSLCTYVANEFEPNEFFMLSTVLRPKMVALDIGANEGLYTCFIASRVGRQGRVIAVEPSSRERRRLERNIALNLLENVTVYDCAVGDAPGTAALHLAEVRYSGQNTLGEFVHVGVKESGVEEVRVRTIDEIVAELGLDRLDLIKIDVEGLEGAAIRGAAETLRRFRPIVQIEITPETMAHRGESAAALIQSLTALGYELLRIDHASGAAVPFTSLGADSENIFAMPGKRAPQVAAPGSAPGFYDAVTASLTGATP